MLSEREFVVGLLLEARSKAMNNVNEVPHGFCLKNGEYMVFSGSSCVGANLQTERRGKSPTNVSITFQPAVSDDGIIFEQLSGRPSWSGVIALTNAEEFFDISINSVGMIDW